MTRNARLRATAPSPTPNHLPTSFLLLAQYGGRAFIPLEEVCRDFFAHLTSEGLARKTACGDVRLPVVQMDVSQKAAKGVHLSDLADFLDERRAAAKKDLAQLMGRSPSAAYVEMVGPRPGEAAGGAFSFGRGRGLIESVLAAQGIPTRQLTPATWKRAIGIPPGKDGVKDMARTEACRRWPVAASCFAAKGSDGVAKAALIAVAGMQREGQGR